MLSFLTVIVKIIIRYYYICNLKNLRCDRERAMRIIGPLLIPIFNIPHYFLKRGCWSRIIVSELLRQIFVLYKFYVTNPGRF